MRKTTLIQHTLLLLATIVCITACSSDDDENVSPLTQTEARTALNQLWTWNTDDTEYALSLAEHNIAFLGEKGGNIIVGNTASTYTLTSQNEGDYQSGTITFIGSSTPATISYRKLSSSSIEISLDGSTWHSATVKENAQSNLTRLQATSLLLSGTWTATESIIPLPDESELITSNRALSFNLSETNSLEVKYEELNSVRVEGETSPIAMTWELEDGHMQPDPSQPDKAYAQCQIAFGAYGNQILTIEDLNPLSASFTGFSYGSNFLTIKANRSTK